MRIGIFDSGVGGLTVLLALLEAQVTAEFLYLGDMARLPYGTKTHETVCSYALQATDFLVQQGIDKLIVACNTASAHAMGVLQAKYPNLHIYNVIDPCIELCAALGLKSLALLATEGTIAQGAYQKKLEASLDKPTVYTAACPLWVTMAEEGWHDDPLVEAIIKRSIVPIVEQAPYPIEGWILGCTHFPIFQPVLSRLLGPNARIFPSSVPVADQVQRDLNNATTCVSSQTVVHCFVTDGVARFKRILPSFMPGFSEPPITLVRL